MNDENTEAEDLSMDAVREQVATMKPEVFEQVASIVNTQAQKRRDEHAQANLGSMTDGEYRAFVRRKFGYLPGC